MRSHHRENLTKKDNREVSVGAAPDEDGGFNHRPGIYSLSMTPMTTVS